MSEATVDATAEPVPSATRIMGVIVAYRPEPALLQEVVAAVAPQVGTLLIVANDGGGWACELPPNAQIITPERNLGLGAAYNLGIDTARQRGASHLLLLDQDSVPAPGMVAALAQAFTQAGPVAATGPLWHDSRTGGQGFFVHGAQRRRPSRGEVVAVDFLISSGSLISLRAAEDVGPFDEQLFIEHVDTDWTLRAHAKGYRLYGVGDAHLSQTFGEATLASSPRTRRRIYLYSPERNYYLLRNSILLWRKPYATWGWIARDIRRTGALMLYYALCVPPRRQRLQQMARAVRDALR
jgi:rhamnosyltransferase